MERDSRGKDYDKDRDKYGGATLLEASLSPVSLMQQVRPEESLSPHDVQNIDCVSLDPIEDAARRDDEFPIW